MKNAGLKKLADRLLANGLEVLEMTVNDRNAVEIELLSVPAANRGKGIGSGAILEIIDYADGHEMPVDLYVGTNSDGVPNPALTKLYSGLGFEHVGPKAGDMRHHLEAA